MVQKEEPLFDPGAGMMAVGILLALAGVITGIVAAGMDVSVKATASYDALPYSPGDTVGNIVNSYLQQQQMIIFIAAMTASVGGVVIASIGRACMLLRPL